MDTLRPIRRALLSVSDKTGIIEFARALSEQGVELLSTGGTCKLLADNGIAVTEVSDHTGHLEIMDGRVKTLHPKFTVGFWPVAVWMKTVMEDNIAAIDMVVEPYPFAQTVVNPNCHYRCD